MDGDRPANRRSADAASGGASLVALAVVGLLLGAAAGWIARSLRVRHGRFAPRNVRAHRAADGYAYSVHAAHGGPGTAAAILAELNGRAVALLRHLKKGPESADSRPIPGGGDSSPASVTANLLERYSVDSIVESSPWNGSNDTSFTVDKGAQLALCLRRKGAAPPGSARALPRAGGPDDFHDINTLTYVLVHELAHVGHDVYGHPPDYWAVFAWLLRRAVEAGIYEPVDYGATPVRYCGVMIDHSVLF